MPKSTWGQSCIRFMVLRDQINWFSRNHGLTHSINQHVSRGDGGICSICSRDLQCFLGLNHKRFGGVINGGDNWLMTYGSVFVMCHASSIWCTHWTSLGNPAIPSGLQSSVQMLDNYSWVLGNSLHWGSQFCSVPHIMISLFVILTYSDISNWCDDCFIEQRRTQFMVEQLQKYLTSSDPHHSLLRYPLRQIFCPWSYESTMSQKKQCMLCFCVKANQQGTRSGWPAFCM